jgi:hypothetical protein
MSGRSGVVVPRRASPRKWCGPHRGGSDEGRRRPEGASDSTIYLFLGPCPPFGGQNEKKMRGWTTAAPSSSPLGTELLERAQSHTRIALPLGKAFRLLGRDGGDRFPLCMHLHLRGVSTISPRWKPLVGGGEDGELIRKDRRFREETGRTARGHLRRSVSPESARRPVLSSLVE